MRTAFTQPQKKSSSFAVKPEPQEEKRSGIYIQSYGHKSEIEDFDFTRKEVKKHSKISILIQEAKSNGTLEIHKILFRFIVCTCLGIYLFNVLQIFIFGVVAFPLMYGAVSLMIKMRDRFI